MIVSNTIKTILLFLAMSALLIYTSKAVSHYYGAYFGIFLSILMSLFIYFYSDTVVLSMYRARPLDPDTYGWLYTEAEQLTKKMNIPMPKLWIAQLPIANAFAVGRNPSHSSVAFTQKIMDLLDKNELRGILAHELSHIKNRDTLTGMVATTMASAIGYFGYVLRNSSLRLNADHREQDKNRPLTNALLSIILPIGATLLRLAISRSREFAADESGAEYSGKPLDLADALQKLEDNKKEHRKLIPIQFPMSSMTASLFIISPFTGASSFMKLLATHPPVQERIKRLKEMSKTMSAKK